MKALVLLVIFFTLLAWTPGGEREGQSLKELSPVLRFGVTVPLSGEFASYGKLIKDGVEFAAEEIRSKGQRVEVFYEDACLPADAVSALHSLVHVHKIHALVANFCVFAVPPMAPIIERNGILAFHTASASDSVLSSGERIFSTNSRVRDEAKKQAEYAYFELDARRASIFHIATDFGDDYALHFGKRFSELGGKVVGSHRSEIGAHDFRTLLAKERSKGADVLYFAHLGPTLGILLRQARELGLTQPALGVYEAEDPTVLEQAGKAAEGLRFYVPEPIRETKKSLTFNRRFEQKFGYEPRILARNAYDATMIAAQTLLACKLDQNCSKERVYQMKSYSGVSGIFSIDLDGGANRSFVQKEVRSGKFVIALKSAEVKSQIGDSTQSAPRVTERNSL